MNKIEITVTSEAALASVVRAISDTYASLWPCDGVPGALWRCKDKYGVRDVLDEWVGRFSPDGDDARSRVSYDDVWGRYQITTPTSGTVISIGPVWTWAASADGVPAIDVSIDFSRDSYRAARRLLLALPPDMLVDTGDLPRGWKHRITAPEAIELLDEDRAEAEEIVAKMRAIAPAHWRIFVDGTMVVGTRAVRQYRATAPAYWDYSTACSLVGQPSSMRRGGK